MNAVVLSFALDTNGQNTRYVHAAERWGADPSVLKALAIGATDPAGVVGRYQIAADKLDVGLHIRSVHRQPAYFDFPHDLIWTKQNESEVRRLVQEADLIHLNNSYRAAQHFGLRKPTLLHHHGSMFRSDPKHLLSLAHARRWMQAVSTIDLLKPAPDVLHWLPTAYDIDALQKLGKQNRRKPDGRIRLVHMPTHRVYKHTDLLVAAVKELQAEGVPVDLYPLGLLEQNHKWLPMLTWAEAMEIKATADIVFDQLMFGYGCNAVEAWGMGIPVIAGGDEWTLDEMRRQWGGLPFYEATEGTLKQRIREMVESKDLRAEWAATGLAHVRKYHDELPALTRLAELYHDTIKMHSSGRAIPGKPADPVRFRSRKRSTVSFDGVVVHFIRGEAKVTDPDLIRRLRVFAQTRPNFGIEEVA